MTSDMIKDKNAIEQKVNSLVYLAGTMEEDLKYSVVPSDEDIDYLNDCYITADAWYEKYKALDGVIESKKAVDSFQLWDEIDTSVYSSLLSRFEKLEFLKGLIDVANEPIIPAVESVDMSRFNQLNDIVNLYQKTQEPVIPSVEPVVLDRYNAISNIMSLWRNTQQVVIPEVTIIDIDAINKFRSIYNICSMYNDCYSIEQSLEQSTKEYEITSNELNSLAQQYNFKVCKNCGSIML